MKVNISGKTAQDIFESIRELINEKTLTGGDILPSVRELAEDLGVNRNTVSAAYQKLTKAGLAVTQGRLGTRICQQTDAGEQEGATDTVLFDLADGSPKREWLPDLNQVASHTQLHQFLYGEQTILAQVLEFGRDWFARSFTSKFEITLCNGAIDTLERVMNAHMLPGDIVVVEDPCYISSANAIRLAGMQVIGAQVDQYGMRPDALAEALKKGARAVLITPRAHNPTGVSLTEKRAKQLRDVLANYPNVLVMEDDHFALMAKTKHYSVIPKSTHHFAIFRSVSKGLGPDLRMAFVAADSQTVARINTRLAPGMSWVSRVLQSLVYTCLSHEVFQLQLQQATKDCASRRDFLLTALQKQGIQNCLTTDGLNVWVPVGGDCKQAVLELSRRGWLVRAGSAFDIDNASKAIRVSVQKIDQQTSVKFAADLAAVIL